MLDFTSLLFSDMIFYFATWNDHIFIFLFSRKNGYLIGGDEGQQKESGGFATGEREEAWLVHSRSVSELIGKMDNPRNAHQK